MKKPNVISFIAAILIVLFCNCTQAQSILSTNPTTCNGSDGTILISGLVAGGSYQVSYTDDGAPVGPLPFTANGSSQILITGLNAGLYADIILDLGGTISNLNTGVILSNPIYVPTFNSIPPFCAGTAAPVLPTTSNNGLSGTWSPAVVDNQNSGTYTFTPTGGQCGINKTILIIVNQRVTPTFSFGTSLVICGSGIVPALTNVSTNGITGTWSPSVVDNQNSGTYTFTPNAGQCANPTTFTVTVNPNITPTFSFGTNTTICAGGAVPALPTTSTNSITGTWSPSVVDNQNSGTYTFTPTAGQCATTTTFTVTVNPNITPTFSFGTSLSICAGTPAPVLPTTSDNGITGTWNPAVADNQNSGNYTFTPTGGQCALPVTVTITVMPKPTPSFPFGTSLTICAGGVVPVLLTTSTNGITGAWNPSVVDNQNTRTYTFIPSVGQCANNATFIVRVNPIITPSFSFGLSATSCAGGTVPALPISSTNGVVGTWSPSVVDNQNSGTYTFTPTAGQCATTTTFTVTINPNLTPVFSFGTSLSICAGSAAPVLPTTSDNGITGTWNPAVASNQNSGNYTFTPTAGQCALPVTITITVMPKATPTFPFGTSLVICGSGSVPALTNTSTNGITGTWNPSIVDNQNSGTYTFTPNAGQCANPATFTVTVNPNITPTFSFGTNATICSGGVVPALPATSANNITGTWSPSVVDNQNSGTYTFTPTAGQCAISTTFAVTINPNLIPVFSFGTSLTICAGGSVPVLPTTSDNGITGTWNPGVVSNQASGTYTFTSSTPCVVPYVYTVTVNPIITPTFSFGTFQSVCIGSVAPILPPSSIEGITGTWNPATVDNQVNGTYTFTPAAGQCTIGTTLTYEVNPVPSVTVRTDTAVYDGAVIPGFNFITTNGGLVQWTNSNPSIGLAASGSGNIPSFTAVNTTNDPVTGIITVTPYVNGCLGTAKTYIITILPLNKDVFVPNVFSPNGDGKNDILYAYGNYIDKIEMRIFNQWGQEMTIITAKSQGWDGRFKGTAQPVGVYVYVLKAVLSTGKTVNKKGSITLVR